MPKFKYQGQNQNAVEFVDPSDITHVLSVSTSSSTVRKADGYYTNRSEIANRRQLPWSRTGCEDACKTAVETESITVKLSASKENIDDLKRRWEETKAAVDVFIADGILLGFKPQHTAEVEVVVDPVVEP